MIRLASFCALGLLALSATAATAQTPPPGGQLRVGGAAGPQTLEAAQARQQMMFDMLDADHDGAITAAELSTLSQSMPQGSGRMRAMVSRADANHDARVTREEFQTAGEARFRQMDKNGNGVIDPDERPQTPAQAAAPAMPVVPMPSSPNPASDPSQWPGGVPSGG